MEDIRYILLDMINAYRAEHGLPRIHLHIDESKAVKAHSEHRVDNEQYPMHSDPAHRREWQEVVGMAEGSLEARELASVILHGWLREPRHREIIMGKHLQHVGIDIGHRKVGASLDGKTLRRKVFATGRFR